MGDKRALVYCHFFFFLDYVLGILGIYLYRTAEDMKGERGGMSKGPQVRVEPAAAALRSKPLYMGARSTR